MDKKAKEQGLIRHICTSFHDDSDVLKEIIDLGIYEVITVQYNMFDRQLEEAIAYANEKGVGVVIMGPVGGGRLGIPNEKLKELVPGVDRIPELALRFVLANPHASVALSGMSTMEQVEENLVVTSDDRSLKAEEIEIITDHLDRLKKMADTYCTGCNYCLPCPEEVNIPRIFKLYNEGRVYGLGENAQKQYAKWREKLPKNGMQADACVECGGCEAECPQDIPITSQLKEAHEYLTQEE